LGGKEEKGEVLALPLQKKSITPGRNEWMKGRTPAGLVRRKRGQEGGKEAGRNTSETYPSKGKRGNDSTKGKKKGEDRFLLSRKGEKDNASYSLDRKKGRGIARLVFFLEITIKGEMGYLLSASIEGHGEKGGGK